MMIRMLVLLFMSSAAMAAGPTPKLHVEITIGDKVSYYRLSETKPSTYELEFANSLGTKSKTAITQENAHYLLKLDKEITEKTHDLGFCSRNFIKIIDDRGILIACGPSKTPLTQKANELVRFLAVLL